MLLWQYRSRYQIGAALPFYWCAQNWEDKKCQEDGWVSRGHKPDLNVLMAQHVRICGLTFKPRCRLYALFKQEGDSNSAFCFLDMWYLWCVCAVHLRFPNLRKCQGTWHHPWQVRHPQAQEMQWSQTGCDRSERKKHNCFPWLHIKHPTESVCVLRPNVCCKSVV